MAPEDAELIEDIASHQEQDELILGNPRWLENFREMNRRQLIPLMISSLVLIIKTI